MSDLPGDGPGNRVAQRQDRAHEGGQRRAHRHDADCVPALGPLRPVPRVRGRVPLGSAVRTAHRGCQGSGRASPKGGSSSSNRGGRFAQACSASSAEAGLPGRRAAHIPAAGTAKRREKDPRAQASVSQARGIGGLVPCPPVRALQGQGTGDSGGGCETGEGGASVRVRDAAHTRGRDGCRGARPGAQRVRGGCASGAGLLRRCPLPRGRHGEGQGHGEAQHRRVPCQRCRRRRGRVRRMRGTHEGVRPPPQGRSRVR